jgi:hypothetical protein
VISHSFAFRASRRLKFSYKLEYLDVTVVGREVGEVRVVAGRAPAC